MLALLTICAGLASILTGALVAFLAFLGWTDDYDGRLLSLIDDRESLLFGAATVAGAMTALAGALLLLQVLFRG